MSNSYRKHPIIGHTTCKSEKKDKRDANRKYRRKVRLAVKLKKNIIPKMREVSNIYNFGKDTKQYLLPEYREAKYLRK
jgi:hypothetical protein